MSGIVDYFASTESESFDIVRDLVESLNLAPNLDYNAELDQPVYSVDDLDVYGGLKSLRNEGEAEFVFFYNCSFLQLQ